MRQESGISPPASREADTKFLSLAIEDVAISKRRVAGDLVRLSTSTRTLERVVDEELTHEHLIVERVSIGRVVDAVPEVRVEGDVTIMPVVEEEIVVQRRLILTEEVHLRRVRVSGRHRETVAVREHVAAVTRIGAGSAGAHATASIPRSSGVPELSNQEHIVMSEETIVAVYDTAASAEAAIAGLKSAGLPDSAITTHAGTGGMPDMGTAAPAHEQGFWSSLFGGQPDHDTAVYDRSMAAGSTVVSVRAPEAHVTQVTEILESHHPIDIDERATGYGLTQTTTTRQPLDTGMAQTGATAKLATNGDAMQLSEESLVVGKRVMNRGGTRIRRFVVETPVEQNVSLHSEKVTVERRPVTDGRAVTDSFADKTIEMTESSEEAVVSKTARVYEEVGLSKQATERVETIHDTVRKEEVEVEQIPGGTTTTTTGGNALDPRAPKV